MSDLDIESLKQIQSWAQRQVDAHDRRQRLGPLQEAMFESIQHMSTSVVPELMAGPTADVRKSILAMEKSVAEFPDKARIAEEEAEQVLASARRRTAALRRWLEQIS